MGHFTDPDIKKILTSKTDDGNGNIIKVSPLPVAIHLEDQTGMWQLNFPYVRHHGKLCAFVLGGPSWHKDKENDSYISGLADRKPYDKEPIFTYMKHPDVKLITISSSHRKPVKTNITATASDKELTDATILKAAGNNGDSWYWQRERETLTDLYFTPSFLRVGEANAAGEAVSHSQNSGPAFVSPHPFHFDKDISFPYEPTNQEVRDFKEYPSNKDKKLKMDWFLRLRLYFSGGKPSKEFRGTSFATPHAGAMIMKYTADMDGIKPYDIIPAALLAAQQNFPDKKPHIRNAAGICFNERRDGCGILKEEALKESLKDVWEFHTKNIKEKGKSYSEPLTVITENKNPKSNDSKQIEIKTENMTGKLVNVGLSLIFEKSAEKKDLDGVPLFADLTSPSGTKVRLPLLIERKKKYKKKVHAGYSTTGLFGEEAKAKDGIWKVSFPEGDKKDRFKVKQAMLITHSLHPESPGAKLLDKFKPIADGPGLNKKPKRSPKAFERFMVPSYAVTK
jgi:hypothetical protein